MTTDIPAVPGPHDITRRELANGIVVLVRENHESPAVVLTGSLNAGSLYEDPALNGLASFTASLLLRGTENRDFATIHETLESNGARLSISGGRHTVSFGGKSLAEDLPMLVDMLSDALRCPTFPPEYVERMRGQLITSLKAQEQYTRYVASRSFRRLVYSEPHPYRYSTSGEVDTVTGITRDQIVEFHRKHYGPQGMMVVIVGAVNAEDVVALVERYFGDWVNPNQPEPFVLPELSPLHEMQSSTEPMRDKSQSDLVLGTIGPSRLAEDWHAANLANNIFGVFGMYGRIGDVVREQAGMAYYSYSRLDGGMGPGAWRVIAGVNPVNVSAVVDMIRDEIRRLITESVSDEELADSKANFIGRLPLQLESNEGVAGAMETMERYQLGLDYVVRYPDLISAVTREDVLRAAQHYLDPDVYALAVAGPQIDASGE